ncbi:unnamed protein product [Urochloa decumbens]|uniref:Protein kinase domain-containing protein n=1 Tax=Urochloa decumbens TaxID=240449 RepID=A0ABC9F066_9POAL
MEPEELTYQFLLEITDGFSEERKVGHGGFGTVYKGVTKTGLDVAVKIPRDRIDLDLDFKQFENEFDNLVKVKHVNIVQFLGYCYEIKQTPIECGGQIVFAEKTCRALCFEYLHNGSLRNHLSDESSGFDWHTRYKIIKGTCEGLRYIHEDKSLVHLDLKPDNILLDKDMVPKIADFGLSKVFGGELTRTTESPLGTRGYQPPEHIKKGEISEKFDIFSLGVIIIRILSAPKDYSKCLDMTLDEFISNVQRNWKKRCQACSNGFLLEACYVCCQVETCSQIALDCLEEDSEKRPGIVTIIDKLKEIESDNCKETQILQPPENGHNNAACRMTMQNAMKQTEERMAVTRVGEEVIVGRDEEKQKIVDALLERIKSAKIVILPIYGIGGIGKTTFAKLIYNDTNFKYYSHAWVYVSQRFDLEKIFKSIESQIYGKENQDNNKQLTSKEILIVLDDLWEDNPFKIQKLKDMLNLDHSIETVIVLVTTRSAEIAKKVCSNIEQYQIESLTDEMCWDIIKQNTLFEDIPDKEKLVDIGKEIAKNCRGVALAAQTLGSMLHSMEYKQWMRVRDRSIWNGNNSKDNSLSQHVRASLNLSYDLSLDDSLKKCFTYCAIFPKGYKIVKCDLIYQWISLDFIKPSKMLSTLQLCEKYIMCLLGLCFLQHYSVSPTTYRGYCEHDTVFMMHDLVHDLAVSLLGDKILDQSIQDNTGGTSCGYALLADCSKPLESCITSPATLSALRFVDCWTTELRGASFEPAESLQALDLSECSIQKLPDSIGRLKQLRYLNAPRIRDRMIPECITKLSNLRYLSLHGSCAILALPESIGEMEGLVHLDLSGCTQIEKLPESFGNLKKLEHVDFTDCINVTGVSECLAIFTKLQYLNLSNCICVGDLPTALGSLTELQYLNLSGSSYLDGQKICEADFWGSLTKLKYLNLSNQRDYCTRKFPESFGKLCNLVHLDLSYCIFGKDVASALNGLTKLQYLDLTLSIKSIYPGMKIEGHPEVFGYLSELRHLNLCNYIDAIVGQDKINSLLDRICTLTNLEYLILKCNQNLSRLPKALGNLRKLHTLDLSYCNRLRRLPASISELESLKFLYTHGCKKLDMSTVPRQKNRSNIALDFVHSKNRYLIMDRLEMMRSARSVEMKFVTMTHINLLDLQWDRDAKRYVEDAEILRGLEPPYSIREFVLRGYNSVRFPSWVMHIDAYLPFLTSIEMQDLPNCNNLPPLGQLPNLRNLYIRGMDSIKEIGADLYGGPRPFPRLKWFDISGMKRLEQWSTTNSSDEGDLNGTVFPCLSRVTICDCPSLRFKPSPLRSMDREFMLLVLPMSQKAFNYVLRAS